MFKGKQGIVKGNSFVALKQAACKSFKITTGAVKLAIRTDEEEHQLNDEDDYETTLMLVGNNINHRLIVTEIDHTETESNVENVEETKQPENKPKPPVSDGPIPKRQYWGFLDDKKRMLNGASYNEFKQEVIDRFANHKDMSKANFMLSINDGEKDYEIANEDEFKAVVGQIGHDSSHKMTVILLQENFPDPVLAPEMFAALDHAVSANFKKAAPFVYD